MKSRAMAFILSKDNHKKGTKSRGISADPFNRYGGGNSRLTHDVTHPQWRIPPARVGSYPAYLAQPATSSKFIDSYQPDSEDDYGFAPPPPSHLLSNSVHLHPPMQPAPHASGQWGKSPSSSSHLRSAPRPINNHPMAIAPLPKLSLSLDKSTPVKAKASGGAVRRAQSFLNRDEVKDILYDAVVSQEGYNQFSAGKLDHLNLSTDVYVDSWREHQVKELPPTSSREAQPPPKISRSKSFLEPSSGDGKVRKILKKSASILYPSWLAANKRGKQRLNAKSQELSAKSADQQKQPQPEHLLEEEVEEPQASLSSTLRFDSLAAGAAKAPTATTTAEEQAATGQPSPAAAQVDGWESDDGKSVVDAAAHATCVSPQENSSGHQQQQHLPRCNDKDRAPSPTADDHPSLSSSVVHSFNKKWRLIASQGGNAAARSRHNAPVSHPPTKVGLSRKASNATSTAGERRWQSMIALPKMRIFGDAGNEPVGRNQTLYNGGSMMSDQSQPPKSFYLLEDYLSQNGGMVQAGIKAQSHLSLNPGDLYKSREFGSQRHVDTMASCPSYESLDEYLLTSDDEYHSQRTIRRQQILRSKFNGSDANLWYCDSFESLPLSDRPPPPADADYSPPDISPDDSSERGQVRYRRTTHRHLTTLQRHNESNRKASSNKHLASSASRYTAPTISETSPSEATAKSLPWRLSDVQLHRAKSQDGDLSRDPSALLLVPSSAASATNPPIYLHDWLPPPPNLVDCGCRLCQHTVTAANQHRLALLPPPPASALLHQHIQHQQQQQLQQHNQQQHHDYHGARSVKREVSFSVKGSQQQRIQKVLFFSAPIFVFIITTFFFKLVALSLFETLEISLSVHLFCPPSGAGSSSAIFHRPTN